jgi:hypothetical protein
MANEKQIKKNSLGFSLLFETPAYIYIYIYIHTIHTNRINGKRQFLFVHCKQKTEWQPYNDLLQKETENESLFFLVASYRRLLFQQMCQSTYVRNYPLSAGY